MVYPGNGLVYNVMKSLLAQVVVYSREGIEHALGRTLSAHNQSTVRQSAMTDEHIVLFVGRQQGIKPTVTIDHQRMVTETVGMVVHELTVEEERAVLRLCHEVIPFVSLCSGVSNYFEHPTYFRNSS